MKQLIILYWGCVGLMGLSQMYFPRGDGERIRQRGAHGRGTWDIFTVLMVFWMSAFMFLRTRYNDTGNYIFEWNRVTVPLGTLLKSGELLRLGKNPMYTLYRTVLHELVDNYHIFFLFPAVFSCAGAVKFIRRYSVDAPFSLVIFFSVGTYIMYMAAMKQCFAMAILFFALPYAIDGKYVRYALLVLFAMLFHTHAFIYLAVPLLFGMPWGKKTWLALGLALLAMATYNVTFRYLMNFALDMGVNVADIELFDGHSIHPLRVIVYAVPAGLSLIFRRRLYTDATREERLFANMSIVAVFILMIGLRQGANLFARMAAYYEVAMCVSLPWMIGRIFDKPSARLVKVVATICYFLYFLYEFGVSKEFGSGYSAITLWQFLRELAGMA